MLLTLVRKSEFILARWSEVDFNAAIWTIPKDRMKAGRAHNVYLSQQALDILVTFETAASRVQRPCHDWLCWSLLRITGSVVAR